MQKLNDKKNRIFILLCFCVLALSAFFRFYNLEKWTSFGMDQEYQAFIAGNIATGLHFPLIGVNASDTGLYLGPLFSYLTALTYVFFGGDPIGWSVLASLWGVGTTLAVILISRKMFSNKVAVFAGVFYASSFLISFYERQYWNPTPIPLLSLLIGFFLYRFLKQKKHSLIHLSFVFAVALQCHLSILVFLPVILYFVIGNRRHIDRGELKISLLVLILSFVPVVLFDTRHNYQNLSALANFILRASGSLNIPALGERFSEFISLIGRIVWVPFFPDLSVESGFLLLACFFLIAIRHHRQKFSFQVISSVFVATLGVLLFYNRTVFEYYYLYLFPWFSIAFALALSYIDRKHHGLIISTSILISFVGLNLGTLFTAQKTFQYREKIQMIHYVKENVGNKPYILQAIGGCEKFGGYRYLFDYYHKTPQSSYMDSYFSWLYSQKESSANDPSLVLLSLIDPRSTFSEISGWEEEKLKYLADYDVVNQRKFNSIYVYILSPKTP